MKLAMHTQRAVDAVMMRLHWIGIPKSQVFYATGMMKIVCLAISAMRILVSIHFPLWGQSLVGFFFVVWALPAAIITKEEWRIDQQAEELNSLTRRDVPVEAFYLMIHGGLALLWIVWSLVAPTNWPFAAFSTLIWFRSKAHASPRYPKPPAKRHHVLAHGLS